MMTLFWTSLWENNENSDDESSGLWPLRWTRTCLYFFSYHFTLNDVEQLEWQTGQNKDRQSKWKWIIWKELQFLVPSPWYWGVFSPDLATCLSKHPGLSLPLTSQLFHHPPDVTQGHSCIPTLRKKSEQRLRRAFIPLSDNLEDLHVHLLWAKKTGFASERSVFALSPHVSFFLEKEGNMRVGLSLYLQLGGQLSSGTMWGYECLMTSYDKGLRVCFCVGDVKGNGYKGGQSLSTPLL